MCQVGPRCPSPSGAVTFLICCGRHLPHPTATNNTAWIPSGAPIQRSHLKLDLPCCRLKLEGLCFARCQQVPSNSS